MGHGTLRHRLLHRACAPVMEALEQRRLLTGTLISGTDTTLSGTPYTLNLNFPAQGSGTQLAIDWGDGSAVQGVPTGQPAATHTYAGPTATRTITASLSGGLPNPIDTSFGNAGKVEVQTGGTDDKAFDLAVQSDGKLVVAGGPGLGVARFNTDGTPDASFGIGGRATAPGVGTGYAVALLANGKVLVGGGENFALAQFNADGTLDASFGAGGSAISGFGKTYQGYDLAKLPDGKIVVVGTNGGNNFIVSRFNADGSVDPGFGTNGKTSTDFFGSLDKAFSLAIQPDGKLLLGGQARDGATNYKGALARYNADGTPDPTFGTNGKVAVELGHDDDAVWSIKLQGDGKIVAAGRGGSAATGYDFALARFEADGTPDATFGTGGVSTLDFGYGGDQAYALQILPGGKFLLAGRAQSSSKALNFALARFNADGGVDTTFGSGGRVSTDFAGSTDEAEASALLADGSVVLAGGRSTVGAGGEMDLALAKYHLEGSGSKAITVIGSAAVDLQLDGLAEGDEESVGRYLQVNDNFDEGNRGPNGEPQADNEADAAVGERIVAGDPDLRQVLLSVGGDATGRWKLAIPSTLAVWREASPGTFIPVESGRDSDVVTGPQVVKLWVEGLEVSGATRDSKLLATFTAADGTAATDAIRFTVSGVDADIDEDNDNQFGRPELDRVEEQLEQDLTQPGKRLYVNGNDTDGDGVADWADGFNRDGVSGNADDATAGERFVPLPILAQRPLDLGTARFRIEYAGSDPAAMSSASTPAAGQLRLWRRDGNQPRNAGPATLGGDYVAPGIYTAAQLGIGSDREGQLWVEAVGETSSNESRTITISVDPDGAAGPEGFVLADSVLVTATNVGMLPGTISGFKWNDLNANGIRDTQLIAGEPPKVVFVIDVSGSTANPYRGVAVGDLNGDGKSNTILDGEIAGFAALNRQLIDLGFGSTASVSIVVFGSSAATLDVDPSAGSFRLSTTPVADRNADGTSDVEGILRSIQIGFSGAGTSTNYEAGLQNTIGVLSELKGAAGGGNVIFLSDGYPKQPASQYQDEAQYIFDSGLATNIRAFGVGTGSSLYHLKIVDGSDGRDGAAIFTTTDDLLGVFSGTSSTSYTEPGLAGWRIYADLNRNGQFDVGEPFDLTEQDGTYSLGGLAPGTYAIAEEGRPGWTQTSSPNTFTVTVGEDEVATNINFGNHYAASVDLDIDSDNTNGDAAPDRSAAEDAIEGDPNQRGKVITANDGDADGDGVPDFADLNVPGGKFTPLVLDLSALADVSAAKLRFTYSDSDPAGIVGSSPGGGHLRIWTKDGSQPRATSDFLKSGASYDAAALGITTASTIVTLWVEGISATTDPTNRLIRVDVDPDGAGPLQSDLADSVYTSVQQIERGDGSVNGFVFHDRNRNGFWDKDILIGDKPDVVFVLDISGSTGYPFGGISVGDLNGDGYADSILDAEIAGFTALNKQLIDLGFGEKANISVIAFDQDAYKIDVDPSSPGIQFSARPTSDADGDGVLDIVEALASLQVSGSTNFAAPLNATVEVLRSVGTTPGNANVFFLSDGQGYGDFSAYVNLLKGPEFKANVRAFGVGPGADLGLLKAIDPQAARFNNTDEILNVFGGLGADEPREEGLAGKRVYADLNRDEHRNSGEPSGLTDAEGRYEISGLPAGSLNLRLDAESDWIQTSPAEGFYELSISGNEALSGYDFGDIEDAPPPAASFNSSGTVPERSAASVSFTDITGVGPFRFSYDFNNDGDFSDVGDIFRSGVPSASFTPDDGPTTRTVRARVYDAVGQFAEYTADIAVLNQPPTVGILGLPDAIDLSKIDPARLPLQLSLRGTVVDPSDADSAAPFTYEWTVAKDGQPFADGASPALTLAPDGPGTYEVRFRALDKDGVAGNDDDWGSVTRTLIVGQSAPLINGAIATPATVTGTTATLSLTATDDGGEPYLRYYWSVDQPENIEELSPDPNGTNAAKVLTVKFKAAGTYVFTGYAVDDDDNYGEKTVTVTVEPTATSLELTPLRAAVDADNGTIQFGVVVRDQFGEAVAGLNPQWEVLGSSPVGTIDPGGLYTAGAAYGLDKVRVTAGGLSATADALVPDPANYQIIGAASSFEVPEGGEVGTVGIVPGQGIAGFLDSRPGTAIGEYGATIDWDVDDAAPPEPAVVGAYSVAPGVIGWEVYGRHLYGQPGAHTFRVTLTHTDGATQRSASVEGQVAVRGAGVRYQFVIFNPTRGIRYEGPVFRFASTDATDEVGDFTADIDWGDGSQTPGATVTPSSSLPGFFEVVGGHTYMQAEPAVKTVKVTLRKAGQPVFAAGEEPTQDIRVTVPNSVNYPIVGAGSSLGVGEGVTFGTGREPGQGLAGFVDSFPGTDASQYAASINWGDGSPASRGTVGLLPLAGSGVTAYEVFGSHTYADAGEYGVTVTLTHTPTNRSATATAGIRVSAGAVSYQITAPNFIKDAPFGGPVLRFFSGDASDTAVDFSASVRWADGAAPETATIATVAGTPGWFEVSGTHTYGAVGVQRLTVEVAKGASPLLTASGDVRVQPASLTTPTITGGFAISGSQLGIMWTKIPDAEYVLWAYNASTGVKRRIPGDPNRVVRWYPTDHDPNNTIYAVDQNLPAGTTFIYTVQAVYPDGSVSAESNPFTLATPSSVAVAPPANVRAQSAVMPPPSGGDAVEGVQLSWAAGNADGYRVFRKTLQGGTPVWLDLVSNLSTPVANPDWEATVRPNASSTYDFIDSRVNAGANGLVTWFDEGGQFAGSTAAIDYIVVAYKVQSDPADPLVASAPSSATVLPDTTGPSRPANLVAASFPQAIQLTWDDRPVSEDADWAGWDVYRWDGAGGPALSNPTNPGWRKLTVRPISDEAGYNDFTAPVGQTLTYMVRAVDRLGNASDPAFASHRRSVNGEPPRPTGVLALSDGTDTGGRGRIRVGWDAVTPVQHMGYAGDALRGYDVERRDPAAPGGWSAVRAATDAGGNSTSVTDGGLNLLSAYTYRVRSVDLDGDYSPWVEVSASTGDGVAPATPVLVSKAEAGLNALDLVWSAGSGGDPTFAYRVYRSTKPTTSFTLLSRYSTDRNDLSLHDSGLASSTIYYYRIHAVDADGDLSPPLNVMQSTQVVTESKAPFLKVTAPGVGGGPVEVSADTKVRGIVDDANNDLRDWALVLRPVLPSGAFGADTVVATGDAEVGQESAIDGPLGTIQPTLLQNGIYQLVLKATETGGRQTEQVSGLVRVKTDVKVGNFTLPIVDLQVDVPNGSPISATRTYDSSLAAERGDFGYGWRLDISDTKLRTTSTPSGRQSGKSTIRYGDVVYITIPGQGEHAFQFVPKPSAYARGSGSPLFAIDPTSVFYAGDTFTPQFVSVDGSGATLDLADPTIGLRYDTNNKEFFGDLNYDSFNPASAAFGNRYYLSTIDGAKYEINASTGKLVTSTDANGNTTDYSDGAVSAGGKKLTIHRDDKGRVDWISAEPSGVIGPRVSYEYSLNDNLVKVTDPTGRTTEFVYGDPTRPHLLTKVIDARGLESVKVAYDDAGKVAAVQDVRDRSASIGYGGFDGHTGSNAVTDLAGETTEQVFNERGDVVRSIQSVRNGGGQVVKYVVTVKEFTYFESATSGFVRDTVLSGKSNYNRLLAEKDWQSFEISGTDPAGLRYSAAPASRGAKVARNVAYYADFDNLSNPNNGQVQSDSVLQADGLSYRQTVYSDYKLGRPGKITDVATGAVTAISYDGAGNLLTSTGPLGETTHYAYTTGGAYQYLDGGPLVDYSGLPKGLLLETWTEATAGQPVVLSRNTYYAAAASARDFGHLASSADAAGQATFYAYDAQGRPYRTWYKAVDAAGRQVRVETETTYDAAGRELQTVAGRVVLTDNTVVEAGTTTRTYYDAAGMTSVSVDAFGGRTASTYDARGNLVRTLYADGTETRTVYDESGRAVWTSDRFESTSAYAFDPATSSLTWTSNDSAATYVVTHNLYDSLGRPVGSERFKAAKIALAADPSGVAGLYATAAPDAAALVAAGDRIAATSTVYDQNGRVAETVDAGGLRTGSVYFPNGQLRYTGPLAATAPGDWYAAANPLPSFMAVAGRPMVTTYAYDRTDALPAGAVSYDAVTDADGLMTRTYKDLAGRTFRTTQDAATPADPADDVTVETRYGSNGRPAAGVTLPTAAEGWAGVPAGGRHVVKVDAMGRETHELYDAAGRLTDVWLPAVDDASVAGTLLVRPHWRYAYDARGNQLSQTDPKGHVTAFAYDVKNRRTGRTLPADSDGVTTNDTETWTYDAFGRARTHTDFKGQTTAYQYDDSPATGGRLSNEYRFAAGVAALDASGAIRTAAAAERTNYFYDTLGRQAGILEYVGGTLARETSYDYDPVTGGVTLVDSPEGALRHAYDPATGRLIRTWTADNDTRYAYDALGRLWTVSQVKFNGITPATPRVTTYAYDAVGRLDLTTEDNGTADAADDLVHDYAYDGLNRLLTLEVRQGDGDVLFDQAFAYRTDGQKSGVVERRYADAGGGVFGTTAISWDYDGDGRLTGEFYDAPGTASDYAALYGYDLNGNRAFKAVDREGTSADEATRTAYNDRDQSTGTATGADLDHDGSIDAGAAVAAAATLYDADGSTVAETAGGVTKRYAWDLRNRLVGLDADGNGSVADAGDATFGYDAGGVRVKKSVVGTGTTSYLQDSANPTGYSQVLEERDGNGLLVRSYELGNDVIAQADGSTVRRLLYDGGGSTRALVDATGRVATGQVYAYDAFGVRVEDPANPVAPATGLLYRGEYFDATLGQYQLRARYYDPTRGAFTSFDGYEANTGTPLALHKYLYAGADPANAWDPSGHELIGTLAATSIASTLNSIEFTAFSAVFDTVRGVEAGANADQIFKSFLIDQAIGIGIGIGAGLLASGVRALRNGISLDFNLFSKLDEFIPEARATAGEIGEVASPRTNLNLTNEFPGIRGEYIGESRPSFQELADLSRKNKIEYVLVYKAPGGSTNPSGGGGSYYLYSGSENRARFPIDEDTRLIVHTHPGGTTNPSRADVDLLIRLNGPEFNSPQKSSQIIGVGDASFKVARYNANSTPFP